MLRGSTPLLFAIGEKTDQGSGLFRKQCAPLGVGFDSSFLRYEVWDERRRWRSTALILIRTLEQRKPLAIRNFKGPIWR